MALQTYKSITCAMYSNRSNCFTNCYMFMIHAWYVVIHYLKFRSLYYRASNYLVCIQWTLMDFVKAHIWPLTSTQYCTLVAFLNTKEIKNCTIFMLYFSVSVIATICSSVIQSNKNTNRQVNLIYIYIYIYSTRNLNKTIL